MLMRWTISDDLIPRSLSGLDQGAIRRATRRRSWPSTSAWTRPVRARCYAARACIETLSYRAVVELNAESRLAPQRRVASITRCPQRAQRLAEERTGRGDRRQLERAARIDRSQRPSRLHPGERGMLADAR
jgi:hypothetical protein